MTFRTVVIHKLAPMTKTNPPEGSAFTPRQVRILKISIAIMTALLMLGIFALIYGMARQAKRLGAAPEPAAARAGLPPYLRTLDLGQGNLESIAASGELLILHWKGEASDIILTIDPRDGHELGRIQVPRR
jgi:hypothetical protein